MKKRETKKERAKKKSIDRVNEFTIFILRKNMEQNCSTHLSSGNEWVSKPPAIHQRPKYEIEATKWGDAKFVQVTIVAQMRFFVAPRDWQLFQALWCFFVKAGVSNGPVFPPMKQKRPSPKLN